MSIRIRTGLWLMVFIALTACQQSDNRSTAVMQMGGVLVDNRKNSPQEGLVDRQLPQVPAMLASRYSSLADFGRHVELDFYGNPDKDSSYGAYGVKLTYRIFGDSLSTIMEAGISQDDIIKARDGDVWDRLGLIAESPFAIANRADLNKIYKLARRRQELFGEGDPAFFDLSEASVENISTPSVAYQVHRDSSEKGYLNTFNHTTAQALITSIFSRDLAAFIADVHERHNMPQLTSGRFTKEQLEHPDNNPVDNYVDIINNELGQQLGVLLRDKYQITRETRWTSQLLADYLNDLQEFYSWSFGVGMEPFQAQDELLIRFAKKVNTVTLGQTTYELR